MPIFAHLEVDLSKEALVFFTHNFLLSPERRQRRVKFLTQLRLVFL